MLILFIIKMQGVGIEYGNGLVYSLTFRKVFCDIDETRDNRLLWTTQVERSVQYGTVPALIQHLVPSSMETDHSYRLCFLAVYRTFISPEELLHSLLKRYAQCTLIFQCSGVKMILCYS